MAIKPVSGEIKSQDINDNLSYLDSKLDQVSGGPKETFTSVSALQSKYPNGANSAMLVTDASGGNGYLYTWSGGAWVKGPLYQPQGLADESVTAQKLKQNIIKQDLNNDVRSVIDTTLASFWGKSGMRIYYNKVLMGYDSNKKVILADNQEYCVIKFADLHKQGKIEISLSTIDANQFAVFENNLGECYYNFSGAKYHNNESVPWLTKQNETMIFDVSMMSANVLYICFKLEDIHNLFLQATAMSKFNDVLPQLILPPVEKTTENRINIRTMFNQIWSDDALFFYENKILLGYNTTTKAVLLADNPDYTTIKLSNLRQKGTISLPLSTIDSNQFAVFEKNGECYYNITANDYITEDINVVHKDVDSMTILLSATAADTLYICFKNSNLKNFFVIPKSVASLTDVIPSVDLSTLDIEDIPLILPSKYPVVTDDIAYIYYDQLLKQGSVYDNAIVTSDSVFGMQKAAKIVMGTSNQNKTIKTPNKDYTIIMSSVKKVTGVNKNRKVMMIGESTTEASTPRTHLSSRLIGDELSIDFIGTRGNEPMLHEGRSGWGIGTLVNAPAANNIDNSFYNPVKKKFDYQYYQDTYGLSVPDYVFINFGINDVNRYTTGFNQTQNEWINFIIEDMRKVSVDIKFILGLTWGQSAFGEFRHQMAKMNIRSRTQEIIREFDNRESDGIYLAPYYLNIDSLWDMQYTETTVNQYNLDIKDYIGTDNVHPSVSGYKKMGDVMYWALKQAINNE